MIKPLLEVNDLKTLFRIDQGIVRAVNGVSFTVWAGSVLGIVGESGCGKSVTALSIMRLLSPETSRIEGSVKLGGRELLTLSEPEMRKVRGRQIGMIFQDPMTSLNPVLSIGYQITEPLRIHRGMSAAQARDHAVQLLDRVGIPAASRRL